MQNPAQKTYKRKTRKAVRESQEKEEIYITSVSMSSTGQQEGPFEKKGRFPHKDMARNIKECGTGRNSENA